MLKYKFAVLFVLLAVLFAGSAPLHAEISLLKRSDSLTAGEDVELGVSFLADTDALGANRVRIHFTGDRVVEVWLDRSAGTLSVRSFNEPGEDPAEISESDVVKAQLLLAELARHEPSSPVELTLVSTLNLLTEARPGSVLDIQTRLEAATEEKANTSLCGAAGRKVRAAYDDDAKNETFTESVLLGPCYNQKNSCLGRCGIGCGVLGSGIEQQLTQDCLNHDLCRLRTGSNATPPCDDEFVAASDDFFVAKDCASMTGAWKDQFQFSYKLSQTPSGLVSGQVTSKRCGSYGFSGLHSDAKVRFTASRFLPPSGCCSSWTFEGQYSGCSRITGKWTNRCNLKGSLRMNRGKGAQKTQSEESGEVDPFALGGEEEQDEP